MKKGGGFDLGINTQFGKCSGIMGKETSITNNIKGTFLDNLNQDNLNPSTQTAQLLNMCEDKKTKNITFLIKHINTNSNERMTSKDLIEKYPYYTPDGKDKFKYDINGDTLSKKSVISNIKKPFSSMFSFFGNKKK